MAKPAVKKAVKKPVAKKAATTKKTAGSAEVRDEKAILQEQRELQDRLKQVQDEFEQSRASKAGPAVDDIIAKIKKHGDLFSTVQRNKIQRALGGLTAEKKPGAGTPTKKAAKAKGGSGSGMIAKYMLPDGDAWAGRGQTKASYAAWEKTPDGKAWRKEHPIKDGKKDWPLNPAWEQEQKARK